MIVPLQLVQLVVTVVVHAALVKYSQPAAYKLDELSMTYVKIGADGDMEQEHQDGVKLMEGGGENEQHQQRCYRQHARALLHHITSFIRYRLCPELTVSTVVRTVFLIVSASFTSVLVTCVSWFACTASVTMGATGRSGSVVYAFPAVSCHTSRYYQWAWLIGGCCGLWLLTIVATAWWLMKRRRQLAALQHRTVMSSELSVGSLRSFTLLALRPELASECVEDELRVPLQQRVPFAWYWPTVTVGNEWDEPVCDSCVDGVAMETRRENAFRSLYGALYDSFRAEAAGWIVVIWLRRLLLIILSVALTTQPSAKYLSFLLLHIAIYGLHSHFQPFSTDGLNDMECVSILVHILIAAVLTAYPSASDASVQSAVLTLTVAPLVMFVVYRIAEKYLQWVHHRSARARARVVRNDGLSTKLLQSDEVEL